MFLTFGINIYESVKYIIKIIENDNSNQLYLTHSNTEYFLEFFGVTINFAFFPKKDTAIVMQVVRSNEGNKK